MCPNNNGRLSTKIFTNKKDSMCMLLGSSAMGFPSSYTQSLTFNLFICYLKPQPTKLVNLSCAVYAVCYSCNVNKLFWLAESAVMDHLLVLPALMSLLHYWSVNAIDRHFKHNATAIILIFIKICLYFMQFTCFISCCTNRS